MNNVNHKLAQAILPPVQSAGLVTHCFADASLTVECDGRGWHCRRAASCVIAPQVGDTVLVTSVENQIWLLAVLERANAQQAELSVPGDLHIHSTGELSLSSSALRISAEQGDCHISDMN